MHHIFSLTNGILIRELAGTKTDFAVWLDWRAVESVKVNQPKIFCTILNFWYRVEFEQRVREDQTQVRWRLVELTGAPVWLY